MNGVTVTHNFETAHRLPHLGGKCQNLHGHSWWGEVTIEAPALAPDGTVVEFGELKRRLRAWIDHHLDHGAMLGVADVLVPALTSVGSKVFTFGEVDAAHGIDVSDLRWPTVEYVAVLLARVTAQLLADLPRALDAEVVEVRVCETHVNEASWRV